jgi:hypothetical protein
VAASQGKFNSIGYQLCLTKSQIKSVLHGCEKLLRDACPNCWRIMKDSCAIQQPQLFLPGAVAD